MASEVPQFVFLVVGMILDTVDCSLIEIYAPMMTQRPCVTGDSDSRASQGLMTRHAYYMEL